jgi:hypothetical protein
VIITPLNGSVSSSSSSSTWNHLEGPGVDGRIILKWIFKKWGGGGMDWINMAQGRDRWRALVSAVMNLRVPQNAGDFLTS